MATYNNNLYLSLCTFRNHKVLQNDIDSVSTKWRHSHFDVIEY